MIKNIKSSEIKSFIENNPKTVLLDVRTEDEWNTIGKPDTKDLGIESVFITISQDPSFLDKVKQSIDKIKEDNIEPDFVSALKLCRRRRIGPLRPDENRELFYKKDMGILARGGFNFELSKRVLDLEKTEFNKLIKII